MNNRLDRKFRELKSKGKSAFIAFITAGYPNLKITEQLIRKFSKIGVDIIELGVPFSDPMADGPVIQEASFEALKQRVHLVDILRLVKRVRKYTDIPLCLMTYYNPVFCFGEDDFVRQAKKCQVDGVIVPDLPPEEAGNLMRLARKENLATIFFVSPTTPPRRIKYVAAHSTGFIYYVSLTGVTGARRSLAPGLLKKIRQIKKITAKPLCVGFGVSSRAQVGQLSKVADGVIVGSAIVKQIKENLGKTDLVKQTVKFVSGLKNV